MSYHYNEWGWYDGVVPDGSDRSTLVKPMAAVGDKQPNWTGHEWVLQEYKTPPVVAVVSTTLTLAEIDAKSIRSIREFLLAKFPDDQLFPRDAGGSVALITLDSMAASQRAKLK